MRTFDRALTKDELETVLNQDAPDKTIVKFYDMALADSGSSWDEETTVNPRLFRIPRSQWITIAKRMRVEWDAGLTWMNVGPAGDDA